MATLSVDSHPLARSHAVRAPSSTPAGTSGRTVRGVLGRRAARGSAQALSSAEASPFDAAALLVLVLAVGFVLPARLVVGPLGAAGRPVMLLAAGLMVWWVLSRLGPGLSLAGRQPVRWALLAWSAVMLATYGLGFARGLPIEEALSSDRAMLVLAGYAGIALVAMDGLRSMRRLNVVVSGLLATAAFTSVVALLQFSVGYDITQHFNPPGLTANGDFLGISTRGVDLARVAGTTGHYIEFGVIMAMVLPIALHHSVHAPSHWGRTGARVAAVLVSVGALVSISRSAFLVLALGFAMQLPSWSPRWRVNALITAGIFFVAVRLAQPGLLGTIRSLFLRAEDDPSVRGRTDDYPFVVSHFLERPWQGRGPGTFIPDSYILLDNQWLGSLLETGIVGVLALAGLLVTAFVVAKRVGRWAHDPAQRSLGHALAAAILGGAVASATFDSFGFAMFGVVLFLMIGLAGALWRLAAQPAPGRRAVPASPAAAKERWRGPSKESVR